MNVLDENRQVFTADQVAEQLQVPRSWVETAARRGEIGSRRIGRYRRFLQEDIDAFLNAHHDVGSNPLALSARSQANIRRARRRTA